MEYKTTEEDCISLIGMPAVGKSTVGIVLAKMAGLDFLDTDLLIQKKEGRTLQNIVNQDGYLHLRKIEEDIIVSLKAKSCVVSTGGSAIYSKRSMANLALLGSRIYLKSDIKTLEKRISALPARGIASDPQQKFQQIYTERTPLYEEHSDYIVDVTKRNPEAIAIKIISLLS